MEHRNKGQGMGAKADSMTIYKAGHTRTRQDGSRGGSGRIAYIYYIYTFTLPAPELPGRSDGRGHVKG